MEIQKLFFSYKAFRKFLTEVNNKFPQTPGYFYAVPLNPKPISHFWAVPLYPVALFLWGSFLLTIAMMFAGSSMPTSKKYPSKKYKKVIKEGLLWDSIEYHERD